MRSKLFISLVFQFYQIKLNKIVKILESINEIAGKIFSWAAFFLVILICFEVVLRYLFDTSIIWMIELEIYFFTMTFLGAAGYAFKEDKHVRVDLFYTKKSQKAKAWTNLLGGIFLLVPWCVVSIIGCWRYAKISWNIGEVSQQPGGLPAVYLLKFLLVAGFTLLLIQGIASIMQSILTIRSSSSKT